MFITFESQMGGGWSMPKLKWQLMQMEFLVRFWHKSQMDIIFQAKLSVSILIEVANFVGDFFVS